MRRDLRIDAEFVGISDTPTYEHAQQVGEVVAGAFTSGEVQEVVLIYTRFISLGNQAVSVRRFMPLTGVGKEGSDAERATAGYEFEPAPSTILETLLPRYVTARLFAALLDAAASEHASRQRAMKAATDNAQELITKLSRVMNRVRQDAITTEITEIVGGAEALNQAGSDDPDDLLIDHPNTIELFEHADHRPHPKSHFSAGEQL